MPAPLPSRSRSRLALLLLLVPALALGSMLGPLARADGARGKKGGDAAGNREYATDVTQGNAKYAARDFEGAIALYRKAIELSPHQATGHYLLGEAQLAAGNLPEAEASWGRALDASDKDPVMHARVLFVTADLKERQHKWDDAKAAWQVYIDWGTRNPNAGVFTASALSRQQVLDIVIKQDKTYEGVRQRIAATADGGVFSDPSKSPAPAK
jgi:tetratricopeptide (TPR) repeat protein